MKIVIVGCGKIGTAIISRLVEEGHEIVAVDDDPAAIEEISNIYDIMCVCGGGADCDTLNEAGVQQARLFVSVTGSDEINMLSCYIARKMGARHTIARIRNPQYNDRSLGFLRQHLNLSMAINPEYLVAQELANLLKFPSAVNIETFSDRNFEMIELRLKSDSLLDGVKLSELRKKNEAKFLVCVVQRDDAVFVPDGSFELKSGDKIGICAAPNEAQKLLRQLGILQKQARNVIILGASRTAYYLSKFLLSSGNSVKVIEKDKRRCMEFCNEIPGAVVIAGDGAQQEVLVEEGINSVDAFVSLTGMDEENILISFFASAQKVPKVIAKVNRSELASMAERLGLDSIVSPKKVVSDILSRYARALNNSIGSKVEKLYRLMDGRAEALEFNVQEDFKFLGVPLKDMKIKKNMLVAGIIRNRHAIIPTGDDFISVGDKVVVLAADKSINDLSEILL